MVGGGETCFARVLARIKLTAHALWGGAMTQDFSASRLVYDENPRTRLGFNN